MPPERRRASRFAALCAVVLSVVAPGAAQAADPGRWQLTGVSTGPLRYFQGVTSDPRGNLFFDGVFSGLYRTDLRLRETGSNPDVIPPEVRQLEGYNHLGDISWDAREGGRVLLSLECFYPGQPDGGNTCKTGSIGVADPTALTWRYYVKLEPAEIAKVMWLEASPGGGLIWTSAEGDLLAYRASEIIEANAAPGGPLVSAVRRLPEAVPPTGSITGTAFYRGRLFTAMQAADLFQVWSINLASGARRLEIERRIVGESEGLVAVDAFGGFLHWMVLPLPQGPEGAPPTFERDKMTLLHFAPTATELMPRLRLSVHPSRAKTRQRTRFRFKVTAWRDGRLRAVPGVTVRFTGRRVRSDRRGMAAVTVRFRAPGRRVARARKSGYRAATRPVHVKP